MGNVLMYIACSMHVGVLMRIDLCEDHAILNHIGSHRGGFPYELMAFKRCHFSIGNYSCMFFKINHHDPLVMLCYFNLNVAAPLQTPMAPSTTICWLPSEEDVVATTHWNINITLIKSTPTNWMSLHMQLEYIL
jgi:hypothetical protein